MILVRRVIVAFAVLALLAIASLAVPVPVWRTGELWVPPLALIEDGPQVTMADRVWIDTDAACGHSERTDPDDCLAMLLLARSPGIHVVGISSVFGNADLDVADRTTRSLVAKLAREGADMPPVHGGSTAPIAESGDREPAPAHIALRNALSDGPLTVVALGPLTNIAAALDGRPDLHANVDRLVAVMGRRPGHLFHPAEGAGGGMLFGHGPVFRDFNFDMDRSAATSVMNMGLPMTLVPYEAARGISLTERDIDDMSRSRGAAAWIAERARGWLRFWKEDIGRDGFYPFDLLAAAYVVRQDLFDCADASAWVSKDDRLWNLWFRDPLALLVGPRGERPPDDEASGTAIYCAGIDAELHEWLLRRLASGATGTDVTAKW